METLRIIRHEDETIELQTISSTGKLVRSVGYLDHSRALKHISSMIDITFMVCDTVDIKIVPNIT